MGGQPRRPRLVVCVLGSCWPPTRKPPACCYSGGEVVKLVKHTVEPLRPGVKIRTDGWNPRTDMQDFTCLEVLDDGWVRCVDSRGRLRMFDRLVCRVVETP